LENRRFCFVIFLTPSRATGYNTAVRRQKDFVTTINLSAEVSCKNLWSVHDLDFGAADQRPDLIPRASQAPTLRAISDFLAMSQMFHGTRGCYRHRSI
jgi:hypothetical protein